MDNRNIIVLLVIIKVIILSLISLGTSIYAIPLCCNQRFHRPIHLLTLNVCLAAFVCANFWIFFFIMNTFYENILWTERSCLAVLYLQTTVNCQVLYGLCIVSLNRLFINVCRNNALFRTKKWVGICVGAQWLLGCLLPLPTFASSLEVISPSSSSLTNSICVSLLALLRLRSWSELPAVYIVYHCRNTDSFSVFEQQYHLSVCSSLHQTCTVDWRTTLGKRCSQPTRYASSQTYDIHVLDLFLWLGPIVHHRRR